jgi:O-antigen ligase
MFVWLLIGYMWLFIHRPFEVWPALGDIHLERVYMGGMLVCWLCFAKKQWIASRFHLPFALFSSVLLLSWMTSRYDSEQGAHVVEDYLKIIVFYVLLVTTVHDEKTLRTLTAGYLVAVALYAGHSLWEYRNGRHYFRMDTVRMIGVDQSGGDPNAFAATLVYSLPLVLPFWIVSRRIWSRAVLAGYVLLTIVCVTLTGSRTAFIGLGVLLLLELAQVRRRLLFALVLAVVVPLGWALMPEELHNRFKTVYDPSLGPAGAQESAQVRTEGLILGIHLLSQNPLLGVGPGVFGEAAKTNLQSHNLYGQMMGELGILGVVGFLLIVYAYVLNAIEMRRLAKQNPLAVSDFVRCLSRSMITVLVLLLVMGYGGHNLYRFTWIWFGAFQGISLHIARMRNSLHSGDTEAIPSFHRARADVRPIALETL